MKRAIICLIAITAAVAAFADFPEPRNLPLLAGYCELDEAETAALLDRGLLVLDDICETNLYSCYYGLYLNGPPVYVTSDAMLYLWYEAHRRALMAAEEQILSPRLSEFVEGLFEQTQALRAAADDGRLRENAVMLAVVRRLLDPGWEPPGEIAAQVAAEVGLVMDHSRVGVYPEDDYTQYEVRGYYTAGEELSRYFRGAKYLARRVFRVADPNHPGDAARELGRAAFLALAMREGEGLRALYRGIHDLRGNLAGPTDSIALDLLADACAAAWGEGWSREDIGDLQGLRAELADDRYPTTRINTRVSYDPSEMMAGKKIVSVLGEHYIPDSDLFMHTCEPAIMYRHLPTGLDVATALGSHEAARKLREVAAEFPQVVPAAQEFGPRMTGDSVYGAWLDTLRALFDEPEGMPRFAQTPAWDDKQINACLTSWAHLRHNYILYGAQAYTVCGLASGGGMVEPLPQFFASYAAMCGALHDRLAEAGLEGRALTVLQALQAKAETFERCAEDQLAGRDTSWADGQIHDFASFIKGVYFDSPLVIADVATSSETGQVLHAASGPFHPIVVLAEEDGRWYGAVGYVGSYYEIVEPRFGRITDEEWKTRVQSEYARPEPPEWLASLYGPVPPEQVAIRERLREIEELLRDDLDAGVAAAEQLMAEHRDTEWEPAAALIAAQALNEAEQYQRTVGLLAHLGRMYGCDARDAARKVLQHAEWHVNHQEREQAAVETLEEKLAPTAPREGLSPEEEVERQDRRAEILIRGTGSHPHIMGVKPEVWRRILEECPRSHYAPVAKLGLVMADVDEDRLHAAADPEVLVAEMARDARPKVEALAEEYAGTPLELATRTMYVGTFALAGEYADAWERVKPLLETEPLDAGPYRPALELADEVWRFSGWPFTQIDPRELVQDLLEPLASSALADGDVALLRDIVSVARRHNLPDYGGSTCEMLGTIEYFCAEPDAFSDLAPLIAWRYSRGVIERPGLEEMRGMLQVAGQHPGTKTARAALVWVNYMALLHGEQPGFAQVARAAGERLAEQYPDSLEDLLVRLDRLNRERRWDEAMPLYERLQEAIRERFASLDAMPEPLRDAVPIQSPAEHKARHEHALAARREQWGELVEAAGLPEDYLAEYRQGQEIVEDLLERIPERGLDILVAHGGPGSIPLIAERIFDAHPDDPRTFELRWQQGARADLLAIAAAGPDAPHFDDAVGKFASTYPRLSYDRSLREELVACRREADEHRGTVAEVLALECAGRAYLRNDRPEQAIEFLDEALGRIEEGRPLRERLTDVLAAARRQVAAKHGARAEKVWELELAVEQPGTQGAYASGLPSLHGNRILLGGESEAGGHALLCLDAGDGDLLWHARTAAPRQIVVEGDAVIVATGAGLVHCVELTTGAIRWTHEMGISQTGAVSCDARGGVVTALWDQGLLAALDLQTGEARWRIDMLPPNTRYGLQPAVIHGDLAYGWDRSGRLRAFRLADGSEAWTWSAAELIDDELRPGDVVPSAPVVIGGRLLAGLGGRTRLMTALEPATGEVLWSRDWRFSDSWPVWLPMVPLSGDRFLARTSESVVLASVADGRVGWSIPGEDVRAIVPVGDLLFVAAGRELLVADARLGEIVARLRDIDASHGLSARREGDGIRIWAASADAITAWDVALPPEILARD